MGDEIGFEITADFRILQVEVDQRAAFANAHRRSFSRYDAAKAEWVLRAAGAQRQLPDRIAAHAAGAEVLVEPACAGTDDRAFLPRRSDHFFFITLLVRLHARFARP